MRAVKNTADGIAVVHVPEPDGPGVLVEPALCVRSGRAGVAPRNGQHGFEKGVRETSEHEV